MRRRVEMLGKARQLQVASQALQRQQQQQQKNNQVQICIGRFQETTGKTKRVFFICIREKINEFAPFRVPVLS